MKTQSYKKPWSKGLAIFLAFVMVLSGFGFVNVSKAEGEITVAQAIANNSGQATVRGYIVGMADNGPKLVTEGFSGDTNFMLADKADETDVTKMLPVQIPSRPASLRAEWGLKSNPDKVGTLVDVTGGLTRYFGAPGLKNTQSIVAVAEGPQEPDPVDPDPEEPTPEVELSTIAEVRAGEQGKSYSIKGTVISKVNAWGGKGFYIQDDTAGIYVYPQADSNHTLSLGDSATITATLSSYNGALQLVSPTAIVKGEKGQIPAAEVAKVGELEKSSMHTLVKLEGVLIKNLSKANDFGTAEFMAEDTTGKSVLVRIDNRSGVDYDQIAAAYKNGDQVNVTGILTTFNGNYQILPFDLNHIEMVKAGEEPLPTDTLKVGDIQGEGHQSQYKGKAVTVKDVVVTAVAGEKDIYVQDINPDGNPKTSDGIAIYNPKGDVIPQVGDKLEVEGVVDEFVGFGFNDRNKTHLTITQIRSTSIKIVGKAEVPEAEVIKGDTIPAEEVASKGLTEYDPEKYAVDFWESKEGMLVGLESPKIIGPQRYGDIYVLPKDSKVVLNSLGGYNLKENQNPNIVCLSTSIKGRGNKDDNGLIAKAGDYFNTTVMGPVTYSYNAYKIETQVLEGTKVVSSIKQENIVDGGSKPEPSNIVFDKDKLTVATYNVENFSASKSNTPDEKVERIAKSIINDLGQPDIISLVEVQDNDGPTDSGEVNADKTAKRLTDSILANNGVQYEYKDVAPVDKADGGQPGGNIRVGFLYRPDRVTLKSVESIGRDDPGFTSTRKPLVGMFDFQGHDVMVVANHLNSKGGDNPIFGKVQPPILGSVPKRVKIAQTVNAYISEKLKANPDLAVVANGDFNDFEFTKALQTYKGDIMINLVENHDESDRYSYFYNGNSQCLDHTLVSNNIADKVTFDMIHINAQFMNAHGRASDHDPQIAQIAFEKEVKKDAVVSFKFNREIEGVDVPEDMSVELGNEITLPELSQEVTEKHSFLGYDIDGDGKVDNQAGEKVQVNDDMTITGIWDGNYGKIGFIFHTEEYLDYKDYTWNHKPLEDLTGYDVLLKDAKGNLIEKVQTNTKGKVFFNRLPKGQYTFELQTPEGMNIVKIVDGNFSKVDDIKEFEGSTIAYPFINNNMTIERTIYVQVEKEEEPPVDEETFEDAMGYTPYKMNLRSKPGTGSEDVIDTIEAFELLEGKVGSKAKNWLKVSYKDKEGYVYLPMLADEIREGYARVDINLREGANGEIKGLANKGLYVKGAIYKEKPNWLVTLYGNKGLSNLYAPLLQEEPVREEGYAPYSLNMRESANGEILGQVAKYERIIGTIDPVSTGWLKVRHLGRDVYVYRANLVDKIGKLNGKTNLRSLPSTEGKIVTTLDKDSEVWGVFNENSSWLQVNYKGQNAFVWGEFVK